MSTITTSPPGPPSHSLTLPEVYRMTVEEYERMAAAGVLDDPRVELINGYLVKKMGKNPPHIWTVDAIIEALRAALPHMWCRKEDPVRIPDFDEPEPDVAVVRGNRDDTEIEFPNRRTSCFWSRSRRALSIAIRAKNAEPMRAEEFWITGSSTSLSARSRFTPTRLPAITDRSRSSSSETRSQS